MRLERCVAHYCVSGTRVRTICSWDSMYGLLNNYFCRKSADGILDCRKIAEYLQKSADYLQMEFWIAEKL